MSTPDTTDSRRNGARPSDVESGVGGLGAFRGRTTCFGAPVLPPGWRPDRDGGDEPASTPTNVAVRPVEPEPVVPASGRAATPTVPSVTAPEARIVAAPPAAAEVKVVRKVRPWSVWKLTLAFALCMVAVVATAGALLWAVAVSLGVLGNVERFVEDLGFEDVSFDGGAMLEALVLGGVIVSVSLSLVAAVLAVMLNLLSDLIGGIEAELAPKRTKQARRAERAERSKQKKRAKRAGRAKHSKRRARRSRPSRAARRRAEKASAETPTEPAPEIPVPADETVPAAGVEVKARNGTTVLDLTEEPDGADGPQEVDRMQLALDELLANPPTANGDGSQA